jgi:putative inorganic carbon (HCO3(-)) transporter
MRLKLSEAIISLSILILPFWYDLNLSSKTDLSKLLFMNLIISGLLIIWIREILSKETKLAFGRIGAILIISLLFTSFSTILSIHRQISLYGTYMRYQGLITQIAYFVLYLLVVNLVRKENLWLLIAASILSGLGSALYGISQAYGKDPVGWYVFGDRVTAVFGNPVFLAAYLSMTAPLSFSMAIKERRIWIRWLYMMASAIIFLGLLFTKTRAGVLAFFSAMGLIIILSGKRRVFNKEIMLGLVMIFAIFFLSNFYKKTAIMGRFAEILSAPKSSAPEKSEKSLEESFAPRPLKGSAGLRLLMWKGGVKIVKDHLLFGIGPETLHFIWPRYAPFEYMVKVGQATGVDRAHNEVVDVAVTRGLIGLLIYLSLIGYLFWVIFSVKEKERPFLLAPFSAAIAYLVQNQFSFAEIVITPTFFCMLGIMDSASTKRFYTINLSRPLSRIGFSLSGISCILLFLIQAIPLYLADKAYYTGQAKGEEEAVAYYERAIELNPYERTYYGALAGLYIDIASSSPSYYQNAIEVLKRANRNIPDESNFYNILGVAFQRQEAALGIDRREDVISAYKKALKLNPHFIDCIVNLANYCMNKGLYDEAILQFKRALEIQPWRKDCIKNLKTLFLITEREDEALECFLSLSKTNPHSAEIHRMLAQLYYEAGKIESFIAECRKTIELAPADVMMRKNLAAIYYQRGEYEKALKEAEALLQIAPDNSEAVRLFYLIKERLTTK